MSVSPRVPRVGGTILLLAVFVLAIYLFIQARAPAIPTRAAPPSVEIGRIPHVSIPPYRDAVPVLVYHDIAARPGRYTVAPRTFAEQIAGLQRAGFHAISAAQLTAFLRDRGKLPSRPILITFDDGLGSAWRVADPILARYHFRAIDFVISGQLGQHGFYYLRPGEVRAMERSGRWDIEAHTHLAHLYIQTDRYGDYGPALTNRAWLPNEHRIESRTEFSLRVQRDLDLNIRELRALGVDPKLFAYPFSASRIPTNDRGVIPILNHLVRERFAISFVDADGGRFLNRYDARDTQQLPRIEVYGDTTAAALLERLRQLVPSLPRVGNGLANAHPWLDENGHALGRGTAIARGVMALRIGVRRWLQVSLAPNSSELWQDYRVGVTLGGLGRQDSGTSDTLMIGMSSDEHYGITLSAGRMTVERLARQSAPRRLQLTRIRVNGVHRLEVAIENARLRITVDGSSVSSLPILAQTHGGIALGAWRSLPTSPVPIFSALSVAPLSAGS